MASLNKTAVGPRKKTHEGAPAVQLTPEKELRRTVLACMLFEDSFYESGVSVADRITQLVPKVNPVYVVELALRAHEEQHLRHAPLYLIAELERNVKGHSAKHLIADALYEICNRPDQMTQFLAIYWRDKQPNGKHTPPLTAQVKKGLAKAFARFDAYQLAKWG